MNAEEIACAITKRQNLRRTNIRNTTISSWWVFL